MRKLRTTHCLHCGTELKTEGGKRARIDRTYCAESCRVLAYRVRRQNRTQPDSQRTPKRKDVRQPLLHKALSALADLQAQIVGIGQSLREEESTEQKHDLNPNTVAHEAETESLRRQLSEVTEKLQNAQNRITELEGIVSSQADRIRVLEAEKNERKAAPATVVQRAVEVLAKGLTRDEGRWLADLGTALQAGYDPLRDPLVDCKCDEICAEQDLADAFEQRGQVPPIRIQRRGFLLFPMAIWAARLARQQYESERSTGVMSRSSSGFGKRLPLSDEEFLCKLSGAQKRELERKRSGLER
ncbi:MAG: hypothetical protein JNM40_01030 [Myxococcales bacterium]|nr:hypothetical protein [Myxococcales bacterium]